MEFGADDYITKPFDMRELLARIKVLLRRSNIKNESEQKKYEEHILQNGDIEINVIGRTALVKGKEIHLTPKEFDLLKTLAQKPRQVFSREQLLQLVWDYEYYGDERTVDAHIKKLRQRIEKAGPQIIQTVWGVGYKFDDSGVDAQ